MYPIRQVHWRVQAFCHSRDPTLRIKEASSEAMSSKGNEAAAAHPNGDIESDESRSEHSVRFIEDMQNQFCYGYAILCLRRAGDQGYDKPGGQYKGRHSYPCFRAQMFRTKGSFGLNTFLFWHR